LRLVVIARTLARHGALAPLQSAVGGFGLAPTLILAGRVFGIGVDPRRFAERPGQRLAVALSELGPAFIKFGQMLSTRSDLIGEQAAADLAMLRDRLPPFPAAQARATIAAELGRPVAELFESFDDTPVSAASIAQVHFATVRAEDGGVTQVAVKVLRPGIEQAFARDLDLMRWLAALVERAQPRLRRLRPSDVVETFAQVVRVEMDLRLEAAAAAELAENFAGDPTYRVPAIDWNRTARRVMTQERLTGIPIDDRDALIAAGHDIDSILTRAAAIFFNQVFRDGYFHGDQHPGNMFVHESGAIMAVDFGIMGRLDRATRFYLADMLLAFLERDYRRVAEVHFAAGYVPAAQSLDDFALACRSIGAPIFGRPLAEISFARVLGQLFSIAETFDMEVQPQLLLLQKNMLMAEGVSRHLNPGLNIWALSQPLVEDWMRENRGPEARLRDKLTEFARALDRLPSLVLNAEKAAVRIAEERTRAARKGERRFAGERILGLSPWQFWALLAALVLVLVFSL
ncbi:MAG: 2-polyprenylphenol 6-hydroxylase, partial [Rhodospirillaceae bacterium]|nr:2-polyprenylphenol 6-hydroxylase [Rhodospirillaceae bacterium]